MRKLLLLIILCTFPIEAAYYRPSHVSKKRWEEVKPYFLPENHPIKRKLDVLFSQKKRILLNKRSLKKAGFSNPVPQETTRVIVTTHPSLPGYIIKTHLDAQKARKNLPEEHFWKLRIQGISLIRKLVAEKGWSETFALPKKWIYPLPSKPAPPSAFQRIDFILVEEDMRLLERKVNENKWKSKTVDQELLGKVYTILEELGLSDCAKPDNIPFTIEGKIAFIDTQSFHDWPVRYFRLNPYLSLKSKKEWKQLIRHSKKK